jgi:hypothetical protein
LPLPRLWARQRRTSPGFPSPDTREFSNGLNLRHFPDYHAGFGRNFTIVCTLKARRDAAVGARAKPSRDLAPACLSILRRYEAHSLLRPAEKLPEGAQEVSPGQHFAKRRGSPGKAIKKVDQPRRGERKTFCTISRHARSSLWSLRSAILLSCLW